jgi:hypothetical protein
VKLPVLLQALLMGLVGAAFYHFERTTAATVVWTLAAFLLALARLSPSVYETSQALVTHLASRATTGIGLVVLSLVYLVVFVPGRIYLRLRGRDPMNRGFPAAGVTNWHTRVGYGADSKLYAKPYSHAHHDRDERGA